MTPSGLFRRAVRLALVGRPGPASAFDFPLTSPQTEVSVWLHGLGKPRNVTDNHSVACAAAFTLCIGLEDGRELSPSPPELSIRFVERAGTGRLLGEIRLRHQQVLIANGSQFHLFRATACRNYCFSPYRDWTRSLYAEWKRWKSKKARKLAVSALDSRCNEVIFSCPCPIALVSLQQGARSNIFPVNLMGQIGNDYFVFALNSNNLAHKT